MNGSLLSAQGKGALASSLTLSIRKNSARFWRHCPALFVGFILLTATAWTLYPHPLLLLFLALLAGSKGSLRAFLGYLFLACAMYFYVAGRLPIRSLPQEKIEGVATFHVESIKEGVSFFNRSLIYTGTLLHFKSAQGTFENLPCSLYLSSKQPPPLTHSDYEIQGTLCHKGDFRFVLKPVKKSEWIPLSSHLPLAKYRFFFKQRLLHYFKQQISDVHTRTLLFALITGEIDEKLLSLEFNKVGLQHLLTVSGFHFTLLTFCLGLLLHALFPYRLSCIFLLIFLSGYALFVGSTCAIQRAYIASFLVIFGRLFHWRISGLNALGVGLIVALLLNPLHIIDLGFQFSFLCTFALLLLYPLIDAYLPCQNKYEAQRMPLLQQHGYLLFSALRATLALTLAVHLVSIPISLCLFHKFSLLGLFYNLFFPTCIALSLLLLIFSLCTTPFIPWIGKMLLWLSSQWTSSILYFTSHPPMGLNFCLRTSSFSFPLLLCYFTLLIAIAIPLFEKKVVLEKKQIL